MIKDSVLAALEVAELRRAERRRFLKVAGASTAAIGGLTLLAACGDDDDDTPTPTPSPTPTPTPTSATIGDGDILNLALNLEYLEAQFYSFAAFGVGLPESSLSGSVGTRGNVTGGRRVTFTDPLVAAYAREIAADEIAHVNFLRAAIGSTAVAQPAINIDGGPNGAFTAAARAAGLVGASESFDPYANDNTFLLAAFLFEDVGVTAYKGAAPLLTSKVFLEAAAGILAAEAYHAGLVRTVIYAKGLDTTTGLRAGANAISNARDSLEGTSDLDQGVTGSDATVSNIVPTDSNGIVYSRSPEQVHNIVYLRTTAGIGGGFFPAGTNNAFAALRTSGAN
ncbi:ferritin-like domain-containing protein [Sphingomonas radiodurans]|uniref:ferritin-like domain-containing protein n=1 Tax=Sphingomonas radiodurans TaxID=2890321 RepID=UPI001E47D11F|nr:ferritin-like domain-containing protein [Sphingomonas radiodurans]WBH15620.1 ferritin-like domain-containing protein [Sphingomonas radiodurans]